MNEIRVKIPGELCMFRIVYIVFTFSLHHMNFEKLRKQAKVYGKKAHFTYSSVIHKEDTDYSVLKNINVLFGCVLYHILQIYFHFKHSVIC